MIADAILRVFAAETVDLGHPARDPVIKKWIGDAGATHAGVQVDEEKAIGLPELWRGVQLIANPVARLPVHVLSVSDDRGMRKDVDRDHPAHAWIRKPSDEFTFGQMKKVLTHHAMIWGNGYAHIPRDRAGRPMPREATVLPPDMTSPFRVTPDGETLNLSRRGPLMYATKIGQEMHKLLPDNVLHIRGLGMDGLVGYPVVELLKESLGGAIAVRMFANEFFGNGANPSGIITYEGALDEEQDENFKSEIRRAYEGLGKRHRIFLAEDGMDFKPLTIPPEHAQMLETREFTARQLALIMGVQPHKLGDPTRTSYNSLEQSNQEEKEDGIEPWLCIWEEELWAKLLTEEEKQSGSHVVEFDRGPLEWVSFIDRANGVDKLVNGGVVDPNEGRFMLNLAPSDDPNADRLRKPVNIGYADDEPEEPEPPSLPMPQEGNGREAATAAAGVVRDAFSRIVYRINRQARAKVKKPGEFIEWLARLKDEDREMRIAQQMLDPAINMVEAMFRRAKQEDRFYDAITGLFADAHRQFDTCTMLHSSRFEAGVADACGSLEASIESYVERVLK